MGLKIPTTRKKAPVREMASALIPPDGILRLHQIKTEPEKIRPKPNGITIAGVGYFFVRSNSRKLSSYF
jgi:hypothetical protein